MSLNSPGASFIVVAILFFLNGAFWVFLSIKISRKNREVDERELNLNVSLQKTDARFEVRGLRFRAGSLGAWIELSKIQRPIQVAHPQNYGVGMGGMGMAPAPGYGGYGGLNQGGQGKMAKNGGGTNYPHESHANYPLPGDNESTHAF